MKAFLQKKADFFQNPAVFHLKTGKNNVM